MVLKCILIFVRIEQVQRSTLNVYDIVGAEFPGKIIQIEVCINNCRAIVYTHFVTACAIHDLSFML